MKQLEVLKLPEAIQIYKNITPETINVPVSFKAVEATELNSRHFGIDKFVFLDVYRYLDGDKENFFQIISSSNIDGDKAIKDFWTDVGRAISVGEKRMDKEVCSVGGIFSSLFEAKIEGNNIICDGKKCKIEILYAPTCMMNGDQVVLFSSPSVFFDGTYYTVRGKFSVTLKYV